MLILLYFIFKMMSQKLLTGPDEESIIKDDGGVN